VSIKELKVIPAQDADKFFGILQKANDVAAFLLRYQCACLAEALSIVVTCYVNLLLHIATFISELSSMDMPFAKAALY